MKVAILIASYNTPQLTDNLVDLIRRSCKGDYDLYVVDDCSDSDKRSKNTNIQLEQRNRFTGVFTKGISEVNKRESYDAYWLLSNDIKFNEDVLSVLVDHLERDPMIGQIAASQNSPHKIMHNKGTYGARLVPFIEPTATLVTKKLIDAIGFWDPTFIRGWGTDFDYGWRCRRAGFKTCISDRVGIVHREHGSLAQTEEGMQGWKSEGGREMNHRLTQKYGQHWHPKLTTMISVVSVVWNEAPRMEEMFKNLGNYFDDIVIVDQSSTDGTPDIARRYTNRVHKVPHTGYCETHRQLALDLAIGDWILVIDPDEKPTSEFLENMRDLVINPNVDLYKLWRPLFVDGKLHWERDWQNRFFRRGNAYCVDDLHTEPKASNAKIASIDYWCLRHEKTLEEMVEDEIRYEKLINRICPDREDRRRLNVYLRRWRKGEIEGEVKVRMEAVFAKHKFKP